MLPLMNEVPITVVVGIINAIVSKILSDYFAAKRDK